MAFKPCSRCTTPAKCKAAGKCLKKKMQMGGAVSPLPTGKMPFTNDQQQKQQIGGSMTPGMMNRGGKPTKKVAPKGPAIMIAFAVPANKKGKKNVRAGKK